MVLKKRAEEKSALEPMGAEDELGLFPLLQKITSAAPNQFCSKPKVRMLLSRYHAPNTFPP